MKHLIDVALALATEFLPFRLRDAAQVVRTLVDSLDLPDSDPAWERVAEYTADVLSDIRAAQHGTASEQDAARLAAEAKFHRHLRDAGLVDRA